MYKSDFAKKYLINVVIATLLLCITAILFQMYLYHQDRLPAVPVSNSLSFNEKLAWLAGQKEVNCDVVASGSSITLNNLDSNLVVGNIAGMSFINISSWGMTIGDNLYWLKEFFNFCTPKKLIIVTSMVDFREGSDNTKVVDYNKVARILEHKINTFDFFSLRNIAYNLNNLSRVDDERRTRNVKNSLYFDDYGAVLLDEIDWRLKESWEKGLVSDVSYNDAAYLNLVKLARLCKALNIEMLLVQTPLRGDAIDDANKYLDEHVKKLLGLSIDEDFVFIDYSKLDGMIDEYFVNKTHLNVTGSEFFTRALVSDSRWLF